MRNDPLRRGTAEADAVGGPLADRDAFESDSVERGRTRADWLLVAAYAALTLLCLPALGVPHARGLVVPALALMVAGIAALWVRPRWPVQALLAAIVLMLLSFWFGMILPEALLVAVLLFRIVLRQPVQVGWLSCAAAEVAAIAASVIFAWRMHAGPSLLGSIPDSAYGAEPTLDQFAADFAYAAIVGVPGVLIVTLLGFNVRHLRRIAHARHALAVQQAREQEQQVRIARAEERERIAREMHDVIAHSLAVMIAVADGAHAAAVREPEKAREAIGRVADTGRRTLGEVRRMLGTVRDDGVLLPADPEPQPGLRQLGALVDEFRAAGMPVVLRRDGADPDDPGRELAIYRIVQESLTNVLRHARGTSAVRVVVRIARGEITAEVHDVSDPADLPREPGRGLHGMRERAAIYHGAVEAGPAPDGGWRVFVRLPREEQ